MRCCRCSPVFFAHVTLPSLTLPPGLTDTTCLPLHEVCTPSWMLRDSKRTETQLSPGREGIPFSFSASFFYPLLKICCTGPRTTSLPHSRSHLVQRVDARPSRPTPAPPRARSSPSFPQPLSNLSPLAFSPPVPLFGHRGHSIPSSTHSRRTTPVRLAQPTAVSPRFVQAHHLYP